MDIKQTLEKQKKQKECDEECEEALSLNG